MNSIYTYIYIYIRLFIVPCWITMKNDPFAECKCGHLVFLGSIHGMYRSGTTRSLFLRGYWVPLRRANPGSLSECLSHRYFTAPTIMHPVHRVQQHHNNSLRRRNLQVLYMIYIHHILYTTSSSSTIYTSYILYEYIFISLLL